MPAETSAPARAWRPNADRAAAIAILVLCAAVYAATWTFDTVSAVISQGMGPEAFPRLVIGVIAVLAVLLGVQSKDATGPRAEPVPPMVPYTAAVLFVFMLVIPALGMLPAMALVAVCLGRLWGERHVWRLAVAAALLCAAVWAVFVRGFGVQLASGLLGRLFS